MFEKNQNLPTTGAIRLDPNLSPMQSFGAWLDQIWMNTFKARYAPQERWKKRPFSKPDALFFLKGVRQLSDLFTVYRPKVLPNYFSHKKNRSSYLAYFLPLQCAKFIHLFESARPALTQALFGLWGKPSDTKETLTLRWCDLGAGPYTASLALVIVLDDLFYKEGKFKNKTIRFEIHGFDQTRPILEDGEAAIRSYPLKSKNIEIKCVHRVGNFLNKEKNPGWGEPFDFILLGNVLNEFIKYPKFIESLLTLKPELGFLFVEPATKINAQLLSKVRQIWMEHPNWNKNLMGILGPCLHHGVCPLLDGRDWCHFSVPLKVPSEWFKFFSKGLSEEREWIKFSYWWAMPDAYIKLKPQPQDRLVVSDPFWDHATKKKVILLCEPEAPRKIPAPSSELDLVQRGDVVQIPNLPPKKTNPSFSSSRPSSSFSKKSRPKFDTSG